MLKTIFEWKYDRLFASYNDLSDETKIIVFVNLLNERTFLRRKFVWFSFYSRIDEMQISLELTLRKDRVAPDETGNQAIERFFSGKCSKSSLSAIRRFLAYESLEKQELFRAALHLSGIDRRTLPGKIDAFVLLSEIKTGNRYNSGSSHNRDEEIICLHRRKNSTDENFLSIAEQVFLSEETLRSFTSKLLKLSEVSSNLTRKLHQATLNSA